MLFYKEQCLLHVHRSQCRPGYINAEEKYVQIFFMSAGQSLFYNVGRKTQKAW